MPCQAFYFLDIRLISCYSIICNYNLLIYIGEDMNNLEIIGNLSSYFVNIANIPILTDEEEADLANRIFHDNDLEAARKMILAHLKFVVYIAKRYKGYKLPLEDLIQEGNIGLMKAVHKFDPDRGNRLISFAVYYIKAEIHDYIMKNWKTVRIITTKTHRKLFYNLRKMKVSNKYSSENECKSIAQALNTTVKDVKEMEERMYSSTIPFTSSNETDDEYTLSPEEYLFSDNDNPEQIIENNEYQSFIKRKIMETIDDLPARERDIILSRKFTEKPTTLRELSKKYKVSFERIRQLEEKIIKKLKEVVEEY